MKADSTVEAIYDIAENIDLTIENAYFQQFRESHGQYSIDYYCVVNNDGCKQEHCVFNDHEAVCSKGKDVRKALLDLRDQYIEETETVAIPAGDHLIRVIPGTGTSVGCYDCEDRVTYRRSDNDDLAAEQKEYAIGYFVNTYCDQ